MRNLKTLDTRRMSVKEIQDVLSTTSIFEKIEFSGITKEAIKNKIQYLREIQVPNRDVLLDMDSEDVVFYWFKNWLHPDLKHWVHQAPKDKRGCSREVLERDMKIDMMRFYENGQQNFSYSLKEIEDYCNN